jgi:transposase
MDYQQNGRLTIHSREQLARRVLEQGFTLKLAAASFNVSAKTVAKWVGRYREGGAAGLCDRSSRPRRCRGPLLLLSRNSSWHFAGCATTDGGSPRRLP